MKVNILYNIIYIEVIFKRFNNKICEFEKSVYYSFNYIRVIVSVSVAFKQCVLQLNWYFINHEKHNNIIHSRKNYLYYVLDEWLLLLLHKYIMINLTEIQIIFIQICFVLRLCLNVS